MPRETTPNLGLSKSLPSDPQVISGVAEHWGPIMDSNLEKIDAALAPSGGGAGGLLLTTVVLTSDQILALDNKPANGVEIIPAPGPGKAILVWQAWANLQFNTTPYSTLNADLAIFLKTSGGLYAGFELRKRRLGMRRNPYRAYEKDTVRDTETDTDYGAVGI